MLKKNEYEETIKFVKIFDKWFDCMNVSNLSEGKLKRNGFKSPYRSADDYRLKVYTGIICTVYITCRYYLLLSLIVVGNGIFTLP